MCPSLCWAMMYTRGGKTIVSGPIPACGTGVKNDFYTCTVYDPFPKGHKNNRSKKTKKKCGRVHMWLAKPKIFTF